MVNRRGDWRVSLVTGQSIATGAFSNWVTGSDSNLDTRIERWDPLAEANAWMAEDGAKVPADPYVLVQDDASTTPVGAFYEGAGALPLILAGMERAAGEDPRSYLAVQSGKGGTTMANLGSGSAVWTTMEADIAAAYDDVPAPERPQFRAWSMHLMHGESDMTAGTATATYRTGLETWRGQWKTTMNTLTGRSDEPKLFLCTPNFSAASDAQTNNRQKILRAMRQAGESDANIYLVGAKSGPLWTPDAVHFGHPQDHHYLWEQHAKVARRVLLESEDWQPLWHTTITARSGNVVRVTCNVPRGRMVLDERNGIIGGVASDPGYKGFVYEDDGTATIVGIDVQGTYIDLQLSAAPSTNPVLSYGVGSTVWGNGWMANGYIHDTDTEYTSRSRAIPLWNWLVPFCREAVT